MQCCSLILNMRPTRLVKFALKKSTKIPRRNNGLTLAQQRAMLRAALMDETHSCYSRTRTRKPRFNVDRRFVAMLNDVTSISIRRGWMETLSRISLRLQFAGQVNVGQSVRWLP